MMGFWKSMAWPLAAALLAGCATAPPGGMNAGADASDASDLRIAESALQHGDLGIARTTYSRLLQAHPKRADLWTGMGEVEFADGELETARHAFVTAEQLAPDEALDARLGQARISLRQHHLDEAKKRFQAILQQVPDEPMALTGLGVTFDLAGQPAEAQRLYRRGLELYPDNAALRSNLGLSLALQGHPREAITTLLGTDGLVTPLPQARDNLALAYGLLGREQAAEEILSENRPGPQVQDNLAFYRFLRQRLGEPAVGGAGVTQ